MSKRKQIDLAALQTAAGETVAPIRKLEAKAEGKPPSRMDKVQIGAFVSDDLRTRLKMLALQQRKPLNSLLTEAFEQMLQKHGM